MVLPSRPRVEGQVELVLPPELEAGLRQRVVPHLGAGVALGQVGGMGGDLVGDHAFLDVLAVRQPEVLLGGDVTEHGRAVHADGGGADGRGDVVVAGRHVGGERAQRVEGCLVADLDLAAHVLLDLVQRHVAGALDHHLHVGGPRPPGELTEGLQLGELGGVVGIGDRPRTQPVAQREGHVVGGHELAQLVEVGVEEVLLAMGHAPGGKDGATAADDAGDPPGGQVDVAGQHAGVDGDVVDALLGLLDQRVPVDLPGELLGLAVDLLQRLVDRHGAEGHGGVADDPLAGGVDLGTGGEVHDRVGAPAGGPGQLLDLLVDGRGHCRVPDVGVDLHQELPSDHHGLGLGVVHVGREDGPSPGDLGADQLRLDAFADGHELHLRGDLAATGVVHLGDGRPRPGPHDRGTPALELALDTTSPGRRAAVVAALDRPAGVGLDITSPEDPLATQGREPHRGLTARPTGVVQAHREVLDGTARTVGGVQRHLPERHPHPRARPVHVPLLLCQHVIGHDAPSAGITRIRFTVGPRRDPLSPVRPSSRLDTVLARSEPDSSAGLGRKREKGPPGGNPFFRRQCAGEQVLVSRSWARARFPAAA